MTGVVVLVVTLVVATGLGVLSRARDGRMRTPRTVPTRTGTPSHTGATPDHAAADSDLPAGTVAAVDLRGVGVDPGPRATLLQFSSAFCAPCRATRSLLADVAGVVPGVTHVEVDVADGDAALELVRRLDIRRTPTTLVLDAHAREIRRASGVPHREQVLAALAEAVEPTP